MNHIQASILKHAVLPDKFIDDCLDTLITKNWAVILELYFAHLPAEKKAILIGLVGSDYKHNTDKYKQLLELFNSYIFGDNSVSCKINENIFYQEVNQEKLVELTSKVNNLFNLPDSRLPVEMVYEYFVYYMRTLTHFLLMMTFRCMGIDIQNDSNVSIDYGSLGTPGRIAKMWTCKSIHDLTEPLSGRFALEPELVVFPASDEDIGKPVTVTLTINAVCSHHLFRFGNEFRNQKSRAVVSYIPHDKVLGLSKINRWIEWIARRGWLQEELTKYIGKELEKRLDTNDVYVGLINMQHGCVSFRGKNDTLAYTTTEYYSGKYEDVEFRKAILDSLS